MDDNTSWQDKLAALRENFAEDNIQESETVEVEKTTVYKERLDIVLEKKGRGGKTATIICGFTSMNQNEILELASKMKSRLATGGSARGNEILIQGDRRADVLKFLADQGFKARII